MLLASFLSLAPLTLAAQAATPDNDPDVTFDISGTFPANMPVTKLTAPNAAFLMEITFEQTVPAITNNTFALDTNPVSGSYSFEGHTYRSTSGAFSIHNHDNNTRYLSLGTAAGSISFYSRGLSSGVVGLPLQVTRPVATSANPFPMGSVTFLTGDFGVENNPWSLTFANAKGQQTTAYLVKITDIVGRLVMPQAKVLAEAQ